MQAKQQSQNLNLVNFSKMTESEDVLPSSNQHDESAVVIEDKRHSMDKLKIKNTGDGPKETYTNMMSGKRPKTQNNRQGRPTSFYNSNANVKSSL